ncbi:hypothetical protein EDD18DRAFT_1140921 [Armillaria luteobubalina]|uniref:Secreted protein n=1 Tax=Armillaria luteobubalina TaxID=153913 RepID=A0AA39TWM5_9AGAR|nr:hypothetical protein EDD18DRAFT_1140921 [Armillaria luteobubalina]
MRVMYVEYLFFFFLVVKLGDVEPSLISSCDSSHLVVSPFSARRTAVYSIQGLDIRTPFVQLAGTVLKGWHEALLSIGLLFSGAYVLVAC